MKDGLRTARGSFFFSSLRWAERHLPVPTLYSLLKPFAFARAILNTAFKNPRPCVPLPDCLEAAWTWRMAAQRRMSSYLNHYLEYFPDRLADPKWQDHCRIVGRDHLLKLRQSGRPAVLAFCHFGPIYFMRPWLRAGGIPSAALLGGKPENRAELIRLTDPLVCFPQIPTTFFLEQLKEAAEFLAAGNLLFVAIDEPAGKQMDVPFCDGWTLQMATGAVRLAIRHQAELIPTAIIDEGPWRFRIEVGRPVPREFLTARSNWNHAGRHLLAEMLPHFKAHPEQCGRNLILRLRENPSVAPLKELNS